MTLSARARRRGGGGPLAWGRPSAERQAAVPPERRARAYGALRLYGGILGLRPGHAEALARAAEWLTELGYFEAGLALDRRLAQRRPRDAVVRYNLACSLALARPDEPALALDELERAVALGYRDAARMAEDPDLASLRGHPRFAALARKAGKNS